MSHVNESCLTEADTAEASADTQVHTMVDAPELDAADEVCVYVSVSISVSVSASLCVCVCLCVYGK